MGYFSVSEKKMKIEAVTTDSAETTNYELYVKERATFPQKHLESSIAHVATETVCTDLSNSTEAPPKPPPRNFPSFSSEVNKSKNSTETHKLIQNIDQKNGASDNFSQLEEYTESVEQIPKSILLVQNKQSDTNILLLENNKMADSVNQVECCFKDNNLIKSFEPKAISAPVTKQENTKIDSEKCGCVEKNVINIDTSKTTSETKSSSPHSMVMAMIYSNKNKGGNKKKNSVMASKYNFYTV